MCSPAWERRRLAAPNIIEGWKGKEKKGKERVGVTWMLMLLVVVVGWSGGPAMVLTVTRTKVTVSGMETEEAGVPFECRLSPIFLLAVFAEGGLRRFLLIPRFRPSPVAVITARCAAPAPPSTAHQPPNPLTPPATASILTFLTRRFSSVVTSCLPLCFTPNVPSWETCDKLHWPSR